MTKFILGVLLLPAVALAQPVVVEKPVVCGPTRDVIKTLIGEDIKETPQWTGEDDTSKFSIFVNTKTGDWTFIQFNEKIACVLGTGEKSRFIQNKTTT